MMVPLTKKRKLNHDGGSLEALEESYSDVSVPLPLGKTNSANVTMGLSTSLPRAGVEGSLFNLQVDALIAEAKMNYSKRTVSIDKALHKLKSLVESFDDRAPLAISEASTLMQSNFGVDIPFPSPKPSNEAPYRLSYARPLDINVVGSYVLKTMTKDDSAMVADMVVTIPASILQEKDYLNYRYFYKRAYYVACLAAGLQTHGQEEFEFMFEYLNGNFLQPIILVRATANHLTQDKGVVEWQIRIIPAAPEGFFPEGKLSPTRNAIRTKADSNFNAKALKPTPFYNATLRSDSTYLSYLKLFHIASKNAEDFTDACILGRIWLRQRGFGGSLSKGGFGHFEWAALTALLLHGGGPNGRNILSPGYNSYQIFKTVLRFLSVNDLAANPVIVSSDVESITQSGIPILYDGPRGLNILFKMTPWSYNLLRQEASLSITVLNTSIDDQFDATFIVKKTHPLLRYDSTLRVSGKALFNESSEYQNQHPSALSSRIYSILKEGLNDRVKDIQLETSEQEPWDLSASPPNVSQDLMVAFTFDPANIDRVVDHGPAAEDETTSSKFRAFWGEKAELRRFKDGSISESLVWTSIDEGSVFQEIVKHLLKRHIGISGCEFSPFAGIGSKSLLLDYEISSKAFASLNEAFRILEKDLRDIESLPLRLKEISAVGPQSRFVSLTPPSFSLRHQLQIPAEVLIQFEGSGRWPDDLVAIQRTKIAFLLKIESGLQEARSHVKANLGIEHAGQPLLNCAYLDVLYPSGASFRLRIHCDREQALLEQHAKDKSIDSSSREAASSGLGLYKRMYVQLPYHAQSVVTQCIRYPHLSRTIRLVKKWFDSHMLLGLLTEELIELVVIRVFIQPYPWLPPSSTMNGFFRALHFISRWDWRTSPLVVDFGNAMTSKEVSAVNVRLEAWRQIDPTMSRIAILAASNHDPNGTVFTDGKPSKVVATRMTSLARSACEVLSMKGTDLDPNELFLSSLVDYDFLIHIAPNFCGQNKGKEFLKSTKFKNLEVQTEEDILIVGYEPVWLFFDEIQNLYKSSLLLFRDTVTSTVIGGLWNPQTNSGPFKVITPYSTKPVSLATGEAIEIDKAAILSEIGRLGGDIVASIEVNK